MRSWPHIWPSHQENVHFYGTHSVDVDGELAKLDADDYRPLRSATAEARPLSRRPPRRRHRPRSTTGARQPR